ncbi:hypothetical protein Tco_0710266 [Tanacetum coccineum]
MQEEEEISEQQKKRRDEVQEAAKYYSEEDWNTIRAKLEASAELTKILQGENVSEDDFAKKMSRLTMVQLNKLTFEELKQEFEKLMRNIEKIMPMRSKERIKRPCIELEKEPSKKQKTVGSKEVPVIQENVEEPVIVKEEEIAKPVKKTGKRHKTVARKRRFSQATAKGDDEDSEYEKEKEQLSLYLTIASDEDKEVDYEILDQKSPIIE